MEIDSLQTMGEHMNVNGNDEEQLPSGREEAFVFFEKKARINYVDWSYDDRNENTDSNGQYFGSYDPERTYVTKMLAFLDEYDLENSIVDILGLIDDDFIQKFSGFEQKMTYMATRFQLRKWRIDAGIVGTMIMIAPTYKSEIGKLLETIRKIVNQEVRDKNKKDKIFSIIASLQSEVDREQTTIDALFGRMIDLSKTVGECAENLEPLLEKMERVKKLFWNNSKKLEMLPKQERPKLITKADEEFDIDGDIPF